MILYSTALSDRHPARSTRIHANERWHVLDPQILAASLAIAPEARKTATQLITMGETSRYRESHAVPFACLGGMIGMDLEGTNAFLEGYLDEFVKPEMAALAPASDQDSAMIDILSATIRLSHDAPVTEPTVGLMITEPTEFSPFWRQMEPAGIAIKSMNGQKPFLAIDINQVQNAQGLLGHSKWRGTGTALKHILRRFGKEVGAKSKTVRMNRQAVWATCIPLDALRNWMTMSGFTPLESDGPTKVDDDDLPFEA